MLVANILLVGVLFVLREPLKIGSITSTATMLSPCPNVFHYRFDGAQWYGEVSLRKPPSPGVVHLKVILSLRGRPPNDYIGEIELLSCSLLKNCTQLLYKVRFPSSRTTVPRIAQILVNGRLVCMGPTDRGMLVTLIQLEHIRNSTFIAVDGSTATAVLARENEQNMTQLQPIADICGQAAVPLDSNEFISKGAWPWLAAIYVHNLTVLEYRCGGSIISPKLVLSAAHCFHTPKTRYSPARTVVALGRHNLNTWTEKEAIMVACREIHIHPDFDETSTSYDADIALVLLDEALTFSDHIRPVCLWSGAIVLEEIVGERGVIVGWGHDRLHPLSPIPKKATGAVVSTAACLWSNKKFQTLTSRRTFCAGNRDGTGPCNGDSGVGFVMQRGHRWILRGIVSASLPDESARDLCDLKEFIVYTDVAQFLHWVHLFLDTYG